jgi:hypothetical protein
MINEPYDVDNICCTKLKKEPSHKYEKENNISPILGTMAEESNSKEQPIILKVVDATFSVMEVKRNLCHYLFGSKKMYGNV